MTIMNNFNLITSGRAVWSVAFDMSCMMTLHDMAYVRAGCTGDVWTTCNGHDQDEHSGAQARSWVYIAGIARRDIGGAQWSL